jgi:hypothetical protein
VASWFETAPTRLLTMRFGRMSVTFPARRANHQFPSSHGFKNIPLFRIPKPWHNPPRPAPNSRDVSRSSRYVGHGMRWTLWRQVSFTGRKRMQRTAKSCGPGAATLALRWRKQFLPATGARKAASPGRARISRKTIARGKSGLSRLNLSNPCAFFTTYCTRCCGRSRRPAFPAPSPRRGTTNLKNSGENRAVRMRTCVFPRHREPRPLPSS